MSDEEIPMIQWGSAGWFGANNVIPISRGHYIRHTRLIEEIRQEIERATGLSAAMLKKLSERRKPWSK